MDALEPRSTRPRVLVICGPTASGKSSLAMAVARTLPAEIVSADSVQVYRGLDIGSAKPSAAEQAAIPHHLIDRCGLEEVYDAGRFVADADAAIRDIQRRGRLPIVAGGTGMYLRALIYGLLEAPPRDDALRAALQARCADEGAPALHRELTRRDPGAADAIHPNDAVRVVRALELLALTGEPASARRASHAVKERPPRLEGVVQVALAPPREALYAHIDRRVVQMMDAGFVEEVQALLDAGIDPDCPPLRTLGYAAVADSLLQREGAAPLGAPLTERVQRDHRRYAKRQLTWLRGQRDLHWFEHQGRALEWALRQLREESA